MANTKKYVVSIQKSLRCEGSICNHNFLVHHGMSNIRGGSRCEAIWPYYGFGWEKRSSKVVDEERDHSQGARERTHLSKLHRCCIFLCLWSISFHLDRPSSTDASHEASLLKRDERVCVQSLSLLSSQSVHKHFDLPISASHLLNNLLQLLRIQFTRGPLRFRRNPPNLFQMAENLVGSSSPRLSLWFYVCMPLLKRFHSPSFHPYGHSCPLLFSWGVRQYLIHLIIAVPPRSIL